MKQIPPSAHPLQETWMNEAALRAYLLGTLTESEVEMVEARLLEDPDLFSQIEAAEDDLFDAYARGELDAGESARFIDRFGGDRGRRQFAAALARRAGGARVLPFIQRRWVQLAVAASLVIVVGTLVNQRPDGEVAEPAVSPAQAPAPAPAVSPAPAPRVFSLALGTSRAAGAPIRVTLDRDDRPVELRIRLNPADRFAVYGVDVRSQANHVVWGNAALQATPENNELVIRVIVPAERLGAGTYELSVRGGSSAASLEDLGFFVIQVTRPE